MINRIKNKLISEGLIQPKYRKGGKCIVMYHGIDLTENMSYNRRFFSKENFEKHLRYYKKNYNIISLSDYFENRNISKEHMNIAITFDDGYMNNLKYAMPLLEQYAMPATFFITGLNNKNANILWADLVEICSANMSEEKIEFDGKTFHRNSEGKFSDLMTHIKQNPISDGPLFAELKNYLLSQSDVNLDDSELLDYYQLVSPESIQEIGKSDYVTVGSHGFYHTNLGNIDIDKSIDEVTKSKAYLESLVQYEVNSIGYPDGSYSAELMHKANDLGYKYQCAVDYISENDKEVPFIVNRLGLYPTTTIHAINHQIQNFAYEYSDLHQ